MSLAWAFSVVELPGIEPVSGCWFLSRTGTELRNDIHWDSPELTSVDSECAQNVPSQCLDYMWRAKWAASNLISDMGCSSTPLAHLDDRIQETNNHRREVLGMGRTCADDLSRVDRLQAWVRVARA